MSTQSKSSDNLSIRDIPEFIQANWSSVLFITPDNIPDADTLQNVTTIATLGTANSLNELIKSNTIPAYIPILILLDSSNRSGPVDTAYNRLIDFLELPASKTLITYKVNFLKNVYKLAKEHQNHLTSHSRQLDVLSNYDGLTGLRNRRQFKKDLAREMKLAGENESNLALMVFNIDLFNEINKNYGLDYGDLIINEMAARATEIVQRPSRCYRYSTQDFAALLPGHDMESAGEIAETLRNACNNKTFGNGLVKIPVTISIGLASYAMNMPEDYEKFIFMAETALFKAKAAGRNRVNKYPTHDSTEPTGPPDPIIILKEKLDRIFDKTRSSAIASLEHLAKSLTGPEHKQHAELALYYTNLLGTRMGLSKSLLQTFANSITIYTSFRFLLHDDLVSKPAKLTNDEWKIIEDLPSKLQELTEIFDYLRKERTFLISQNENYDGTGYPEGCKGEEIPLGARILKIIDAFAAMNGERPYRKPLTPEQIIDELYLGAGKEFDPTVVLELLRVIDENALLDISGDHLLTVQKNLSENLKDLII